jgi:hypothetical protein
MGRDEGDGQTGDFLLEPPLEVKTRHAAKLDVRDQKAGAGMIRIVKEGLGREIGFHVITRQVQQAAQCLAHAFVIVDDRDEGRDFLHDVIVAEKPDELP